MRRSHVEYDRFPGFLATASADTAATRLAATDRALAEGIGHKLFTVLVINWDQHENQRCYSSLPEAYPVGGAKPIAPGSMARLLDGECRFLDTYEDVKAAFPDHALIRSLGCESCVNIPVRWDGKTIGMLNLLHAAKWYTPADVPTFTIFAALAAPALHGVIAGWTAAA
ncbi:MAG: GAF domain-containing protein [Acetobacteraceae bacterium]|nr:GAF domain-containing protein [Acetobacteraceae bacterium]